MSFEDPIVAEVRSNRERLLAEAGGFDEYMKKLKSLESGDTARLVTHVGKLDGSKQANCCAENGKEYKGER